MATRKQSGSHGAIVPEQIRAARAMLGWSHFRLARKARVGRATVQRVELGMTVWPSSVQAIKIALERAGINFVPPESGGPGVCVRSHTRKGQNVGRPRP
jgi:transcriptional regulator with XRE-family HTH domain